MIKKKVQQTDQMQKVVKLPKYPTKAYSNFGLHWATLIPSHILHALQVHWSSFSSLLDIDLVNGPNPFPSSPTSWSSSPSIGGSTTFLYFFFHIIYPQIWITSTYNTRRQVTNIKTITNTTLKCQINHRSIII